MSDLIGRETAYKVPTMWNSPINAIYHELELSLDDSVFSV